MPETIKLDYKDKPFSSYFEGPILRDLVEWINDHELESKRDVILTLEMFDPASGCMGSLIYSQDIADKVSECWLDIDNCIDEYQEQTGEFVPSFDSIGSMVWFAYSWRARELAGVLRNHWDLDDA